MIMSVAVILVSHLNYRLKQLSPLHWFMGHGSRVGVPRVGVSRVGSPSVESSCQLIVQSILFKLFMNLWLCVHLFYDYVSGRHIS